MSMRRNPPTPTPPPPLLVLRLLPTMIRLVFASHNVEISLLQVHHRSVAVMQAVIISGLHARLLRQDCLE